MTKDCQTALEYAREHRAQFLEDLQDFIRIQSISTDPDAIPEIQRAAEWAAERLRALGMQNVGIYPTSGHPVVYGEWQGAGPEAPTVLLYGHYDVQPAEPLDLWESPPFEATQRGDYLFGRGTSDMKGQVIVTIHAVEALLRAGQLPVNLKFLIEGEEEIGSPSLEAFLPAHLDLLACDFTVNPDTGMIGAEIPTITYGLRGLAYFEVRINGPDKDLHSGLYGGAIHNPAQVLCELVAGMHDAEGRVTLPGFYDSVRPLSEEERAELARLPVGDSDFLQGSGAPALYGEAGYSAVERVGARPTLEVNGLLSGFTGQGQKTVLPAKAMVKISTRLVPDQDPEAVYQQLLRYLEAKAPPTVRWEVIRMAGAPASITDRHLPAVEALSQAMEATWGKRPVLRREGGSVPIVWQMQKYLGVESVLTGFGLPEDNIHSPNERVHLPTLYRGEEAFIRFLCNLGK